MSDRLHIIIATIQAIKSLKRSLGVPGVVEATLTAESVLFQYWSFREAERTEIAFSVRFADLDEDKIAEVLKYFDDQFRKLASQA